MITEPQPTPKSRKNILLAIGAFVLVAILAGAAFLAGRLMNKKSNSPGMSGMQIAGGNPNGLALPANGAVVSGGGLVVSSDSSGGGSFQPAPELPTTTPETSGIFVRRDDNSIFLGTGNMGVTIMSGSSSDSGGPSVSVGGPSEASASYDGPVVEVVVTKETHLYREATEFDPENPSATIQQKVEEGDLDDFNSMSMITVWGKKTGDRIVADVIFYSQPMMIKVENP